MRTLFICLVAVGIGTIASAQSAQPDWTRLEDETMRHFQALVRIDTTDPPGGEAMAVEYLKQALESELHRFVRFHYDVVFELARAK